jgi:hypothetical protein
MFLRKTEGFKMSYVKLTNYAIKDALLTGDPNKIVKGIDIDAEFNAIATASAVTDAAYVAGDVIVAANAAAATALKLSTSTAATTYAPLSSPALIDVPTAPTATVGTNTTQIATMAALLNQAFTTGFPSQTGNGGKFATTDGVNVSWGIVGGLGGATITTSVTLTSTSPASMLVNVTSLNKYATLPDATTMSKGSALFNFYNNSEFFYGIKNKSGTTLGWIEPYTNVTAHLPENATLAGTWSFDGLSRIGVTAEYINTSSAMGGNLLTRCVIDTDKEAFAFCGNANSYVVVYNHTTQTWGTPVQVVASALKVSIVSNGTNKLFACYGSASSLYIVPFTISGESLTPTTGANLSTGGTTYTGAIAYLNNSVVVGFYDTVNSQVVGINVTSTPSFGSPSISSSVSVAPISIYVYGTNVVSVQQDKVIAFAVSGSTLTVGASFSGGFNETFYTGLLSSGNLIVVDLTSVSLYKMTGATLTRSQSVFSAIAAIDSSASKINDKIIVMWSDALNKTYYQAFADVSGTITPSTLYTITHTGVNIGVTIGLSSENELAATFQISRGYQSSSATSTFAQQLVTIGMSGSEPILIGTKSIGQITATDNNKVHTSNITPTTSRRINNYRILKKSGYGRFIGSGDREFDVETRGTSAGIITTYLGRSSVSDNALPTNTYRNDSFEKGVNDSIGYFSTNLIGRGGIIIKRIEVA